MSGAAWRLPDIAAALRNLHVSISQQQDLTKVVIQDAENARAEFRALTTGATKSLVGRALGNYAQGIAKLRDGSWLLAEAGGILAESPKQSASTFRRGGPLRRSGRSNRFTASRATPALAVPAPSGSRSPTSRKRTIRSLADPRMRKVRTAGSTTTYSGAACTYSASNGWISYDYN